MKRIYKYISHCASALLRTLSRASVPAALALALLLTPALNSCHKVEIDPELDGKYAIAFDEISVDTKAVITSAGGISEFDVWGAVKENISDGDYENIFEDVSVKKGKDDNDNVIWTYQVDPQYWQENSKYRFFAVAPTSHDVTYDNNTMTYGVNYAVPDRFNVSDAEFNDIVAATKTVETSAALESDPGKVDLSFKHPITKVNLHISKSSDNAEDKMVVTNVSLTGMRDSGTYTYYLETGLTEWTFKASTSSLVYESDYEVNVDEYIGDDKDEEGWLKLQFYTLPQYISDNTVRLQITYKYTEKSAGAEETKSYNVYLPQTDVWKENNIITYKVELSADHKIRFYIYKVDTWGLMPSGTVIIQ